MFRRDMLGNCLALMVKWSIEAAARPIYHHATHHACTHCTAQQHNDTAKAKIGFYLFALFGKKFSFYLAVVSISDAYKPFLLGTSCEGGRGGKHGKVLRRSRKSK